MTFLQASPLLRALLIAGALSTWPLSAWPLGAAAFDLSGPGPIHGCPACEFSDFERQVIAGDIVHYSWTLRVGPGALDRIGMHRVVRERFANLPARTEHAIFLTHGARTGFKGTFLSTLGLAGLDPTHNLAAHLAEQGVDVWGIDMRWTRVSEDAADLSPIATWGMAQDVEDLDRALSVARNVRRLSANGNRKISLLGYSYGGRVGYAFLDHEAEKARGQRHIARYVALEGVFKTADMEVRQEACNRIDSLQANIDNGLVATSSEPLAFVGGLALHAPDGPSPMIPGFTNRQAALFFISQRTLSGLLPLHGFAGTFADGFPTGLRFSQEAAAFNLFASASGVQPTAAIRDLMIVLCDDQRSTLDDRLAEIRVPVFYLGATGGFNRNGLDTFPFLGSEELQSHLVSYPPAGSPAANFGHGDILMMDAAERLVWQPILEWITTR